MIQLGNDDRPRGETSDRTFEHLTFVSFYVALDKSRRLTASDLGENGVKPTQGNGDCVH